MPVNMLQQTVENSADTKGWPNNIGNVFTGVFNPRPFDDTNQVFGDFNLLCHLGDGDRNDTIFF